MISKYLRNSTAPYPIQNGTATTVRGSSLPTDQPFRKSDFEKGFLQQHSFPKLEKTRLGKRFTPTTRPIKYRQLAIVFKPRLTLWVHEKREVVIYITCDMDLVDRPVFNVIKIPHNHNSFFELRHRCCCPDACAGTNILADPFHDTTLVRLDLTDYGNVEDYGPALVINGNTDYNISDRLFRHTAVVVHEAGPWTQLWIVLAVNLSLISFAIFIGVVFCRSRNSYSSSATRVYGKLPVKVSGSHLTMTSVESFLPLKQSQWNSATSQLLQSNSPHSSTRSLSKRERSRSRRASVGSTSECVVRETSLEIGQRLGGGRFNDTYLGEYQEKRVAVKRMIRVHQSPISEECLESIIAYLKRLRNLNHTNIAATYGLCFELKYPYVVTELIDSLSLKYLLTRDMSLEWSAKLKLCLQATKGLNYLHSKNPPILHRDFRCANLLVDNNEQLRIVDYGITHISQLLREECSNDEDCFCLKSQSALPSSVRWTPPELLNNPITREDSNPKVMSPAVDVYSFAMVLWEVASHLDPYADISDETEVREVVIKGGRPNIDSVEDMCVAYRVLVHDCWSQNAHERPIIKRVHTRLKELQNDFIKSSKKYLSQPDLSVTAYLKSALNLG